LFSSAERKLKQVLRVSSETENKTQRHEAFIKMIHNCSFLNLQESLDGA
jgi:hypothetical protein